MLTITDTIIIPADLKKTFDHAFKRNNAGVRRVKEEQDSSSGSWIITITATDIYSVFKLGRKFEK